MIPLILLQGVYKIPKNPRKFLELQKNIVRVDQEIKNMRRLRKNNLCIMFVIHKTIRNQPQVYSPAMAPMFMEILDNGRSVNHIE